LKVTLDIQTEALATFPTRVVRTVTENSRTLNLTQHGFEHS
jgi:hypothetical protein